MDQGKVLNEEVKNCWPRIALVTPAFNASRYIEATIQSVLAQEYPNLDYFIVDGGSKDGTIEIIRKYEKQISGWVSEPDAGIYDAINKGFGRTTGEVMGWLNANDLLHANGLRIVGSVFSALPAVEWITGWPTWFTDEGDPMVVERMPRWSRGRYLAGANRFIQQESTYWRRSLWDRAGGKVSTKYRVESDFDLWVRFFRYAKLHTVEAQVAGYRCHPNALSQGDPGSYARTCDEIADGELATISGHAFAKAFRKTSKTIGRIPKVRVVWKKLAVESLYRVPGPDWPAVIRHEGGAWKFGKKG